MKKLGKEKAYKKPAQMKDHWEMDVSRSINPRKDPKVLGQEMLAAPATQRQQPHVKVNECDY